MSASTSLPRSAVAEPRAIEFELDAAAISTSAPTLETSARLSATRTAPSGRRLETSARLVPIRAELIVLLAFLRIAQHLVCFVDLLELFLGGLLILRHIGMMFSRQFAKGGANFIIARRLRDAQRLIIISKLDSHLSEKVQRGALLIKERRFIRQPPDRPFKTAVCKPPLLVILSSCESSDECSQSLAA